MSPDALSDFLKSHKFKREGMTALKEKKKRNFFFFHPFFSCGVLINVSRLLAPLFFSCQPLTLDLNGFSSSAFHREGDFELIFKPHVTRSCCLLFCGVVCDENICAADKIRNVRLMCS